MKLQENYKNIFEFLREHLRTKEKFTREALLSNFPDLSEKSRDTYFNKKFEPLLSISDDNTCQVGENFRKYSSEDKFARYMSQKNIRPIYQKESYAKVIIFEFFMPLTNENFLKDALDSLFYKDTMLPRIKNVIGEKKLQKLFEREKEEELNGYFERVCNWISDRFAGYSIQHVQGRFKANSLMTLDEAAKAYIMGEKYLIDETTAIVKFIFPIGKVHEKKDLGILSYFDQENESEKISEENSEEERDAKRVSWLFDALFVSTIVDLVGEDEIWMIESGIKNQLHVWKKSE